ncbi:MAG TPA: hypothetical protein VGZ28_00140 [Terriglobales bacterium]|nr:hypothetical protein [Terriglobales bacterium]
MEIVRPNAYRRPKRSGPASSPRWRRDGKEIFYVTPDGGLMSAPVTVKGDAIEVGEPRALFRPAATISLDSLGPPPIGDLRHCSAPLTNI